MIPTSFEGMTTTSIPHTLIAAYSPLFSCILGTLTVAWRLPTSTQRKKPPVEQSVMMQYSNKSLLNQGKLSSWQAGSWSASSNANVARLVYTEYEGPL